MPYDFLRLPAIDRQTPGGYNAESLLTTRQSRRRGPLSVMRADQEAKIFEQVCNLKHETIAGYRHDGQSGARSLRQRTLGWSRSDPKLFNHIVCESSLDLERKAIAQLADGGRRVRDQR